MKMEGLGNSYILIEDLEKKLKKSYSRMAFILSNKNYGIGSDGLLVINQGCLAPFSMRIFNPDGSEAEMCGNGLRMVSRYLWDKKLWRKKEVEIEVLGGKVFAKLNLKGRKVFSVRVAVGKGEFLEADKEIDVGMKFRGSYVKIGNPHFIIFGKSTEEIAKKYGPLLENHKEFLPERVNVEFAEPRGKNSFLVKVWERGAGWTLACGSGACAVAFAAKKLFRGKRDFKIILPGGILFVSVLEDDTIFLEGPADYICRGKIELEQILKKHVVEN